MAEGDLKSSAQIDFADKAKEGLRRLTLEMDDSDSLVPAEGTSYVRVFPSAANPKVTAVKGIVTRVGAKVPYPVDEWVTFTGSDSSTLKHEPSGEVVISEPSFFGAKPAIAYKEDDNAIVLDRVSHGILKVKYTAMFDRYLVYHGGNPCRTVPLQILGDVEPAPQTTEQKYFDMAFVVAEAVGYEMASLEVAGPSCIEKKTPEEEVDPEEQDLSWTIQFSDYEPVGIKIEEDVAIPSGLYPYYFSAENTPLGFTMAPQTVTLGGALISLYAGCRVRVYPRVAVSLIGINCAVGASPLGSGSKPVLRALTFSGNSSQGLDYPVSSAISVSGFGGAVSIFGERISVEFRKPGDWVNEVTWKDRSSFSMTPGARIVKEDEIVAVTSANNTIPCYTFCQVQYTSDYYLYDVLFNWDTTIGWYAPAMILAVGANSFGSLEIQPPGKGGVL